MHEKSFALRAVQLVSPSGRDVAQRQRGLKPSDIAFQICPDTNLPAFCPLSHLLCKCQLSQGESREAGANCTPDASGELLRRLVRVLLLPSRLAPRHLPQRGRLFLLCVHAGIKKDCHQAVRKRRIEQISRPNMQSICNIIQDFQ